MGKNKGRRAGHEPFQIGRRNASGENDKRTILQFIYAALFFEKAPSHCKFMHCLPASRGVEATDEVMDHPRSIIFDQSENRLHTEKGLLVYFVYPRLKRPSEEIKALHKGQIEALLNDPKFGK